MKRHGRNRIPFHWLPSGSPAGGGHRIRGRLQCWCRRRRRINTLRPGRYSLVQYTDIVRVRVKVDGGVHGCIGSMIWWYCTGPRPPYQQPQQQQSNPARPSREVYTVFKWMHHIWSRDARGLPWRQPAAGTVHLPRLGVRSSWWRRRDAWICADVRVDKIRSMSLGCKSGAAAAAAVVV